MLLTSQAPNWVRHQFRVFTLSLLTLSALLLVALSPQKASAAVECVTPSAGLPTISLTKEMPAEQLYATPIPVTLHASQPAAPPAESGFNLSFRDVLPVGVSYRAGSSNPAPQVINDQPSLGMTTLIWSNVADLAPGADYELRYEVEYDPSIFDAGDAIETGATTPVAAAGAYVNCNPRWIPIFNAQGLPIGTASNSASSSATAAPEQTLLKAIEIEKSEPSPENELLRGVHSNQTPYTLTIRNNTQRPTDNLVVVDYLPAGLEFLGCSDVDNTTNVPYNLGSDEEYPGSGGLDLGTATPHPCIEPTSVETGTFDPDGAGPAGSALYTRVEWNLGSTLAALEEFQMSYVAGIPICPNTATWLGAEPSATSLEQTANLNNNNCSGGETVDEAQLRNFATASGDYHQLDGDVVLVSDTDDHTVTAEDLAVWKESDDDQYAVGETVRWSLHIRTSEYRNISDLVVSDLVPNGMCPVVGTTGTPPSSDAECAATGQAADNPSLIWDSATESLSGADDGSWTLTWNLGDMPADQDQTISFSTKARIFYQSGGDDAGRVLATDPLTNNVEISGQQWPICTNDPGDAWPCDDPSDQLAHTQTPGAEIDDVSEATVHSGLPTLKKQVATPDGVGSPANCPTPSSSDYIDGTAGVYRTGDIVCWKLRVEFPGTVSTGDVTITDFLPAGSEYVPGVPGTGPTANNDVGIASVTDNDSFVDFALTTPDVDETGRVFEYIIATRMLNLVADPDEELPPVRGNLLKMTSVNTAGEVTTYRDEANAEIRHPELAITKGVKSIDGSPSGGNGPNVDGGTVVGGEPVVYRVDVSNTGLVDAVGTTVVERLVGPYDCSMVSAISHSGTCATTGTGVSALTEVTWTGVGVATGGSTELNFTVTYPDSIAPGVRINDNACVKDFQNETNDLDNPTYTWVVDNPVATCGDLSAVPPQGQLLEDEEINDPSWVTPPGSITKTVTTSVDETNNSLTGQATIGETISYSVTVSVPDGTTMRDMLITDAIQDPARQAYVSGSVACSSSVAGFCLAATTTFGFWAANTAGLQAGGAFLFYTNNSGSAQTFTLSFDVKVLDVVGNAHGGTLTNRGSVSYHDQYGASQNADSNTTTVTIVEPNPGLVKTDDDADGVVVPGQEIQYTVTASNPSGRSPLHESVVVDTVPAHLTVTDGAGTPLTDGQTVVLCDGSSAGAPAGTFNTPNTITWSLGTLAPGASIGLRYCAEVNESPAPPASVPLTNEVTLTGTSMPGVIPGERTYTREDDNTVRVAGSQLTKTVNKPTATIGELVDYTIAVTLPANTEFYSYKLMDTLPTGIEYIAVPLAPTCAPAGPACAAVPTPTVGTSGQTVTWSYGDIPAASVDRTLTLTFQARIDDIAANADGVTLTNTAANEWCLIDAEPCDPDDLITPPGDTADVDLVEPNLTIDKDVNCQTADADECDVQPGDSFTYTVTVTNNGHSTAYDAVFQDDVPDELTNVVVGTLPAGVTATTPTGSNTHAWLIDELPVGGSKTITYTADLVASDTLSDPFTVVNTASVTEYWGLDDLDRSGNPDAREYPGTDPTDTVTLNGHLPQPEVVKTVANSGNAEINQCLTWTLTISNNSEFADLNNIDVSDTLPTGWVYCAGTTQKDSVAYSDPTITPPVTGTQLAWNDVGDIAGDGDDIVLTFGARPTMAALTAGEPTNPYTNNVTITGEDNSGSDESDDGPYTSTDHEDANIQMPNLTIAKTTDDGSETETVEAGGWHNWKITVTNTGPGTARNVLIRDAVPTNLTFDVAQHPATVVCTPLPCDNPVGPHSGPPLNMVVNSGTGPVNAFWTLDSLPANSSVTITLPMRVPSDAVDGSTWTNTAGVTSTERPTEITDTAGWESERSTDLAITKTGTPNPGTAGENITYTLTVTNNGPSIGTGVTVEDVIDTSQFEYVSATPTDTVNDSCTHVTTPTDKITCTVGQTLNPTPGTHSTATFTVVLKVLSGLTGNVANTATVDGNEPDPDTDNNEDEEVTPLGTVADVGITKSLATDAPGSIPNHDTTTFELVVTNHGPSDALDVEVTDTLPAGLSCVSAGTTPAPVSGCTGIAGSTIVWDIGTLAADASTTITVVVRGEAVGDDWLNEAEVDSSTTDDNPDNNEDSATVDVTPMADLSLEKSGDPAVASGASFTYTLSISNDGPDAATTPTVVDTLPAGLTFVNYGSTGDEASCAVTAGTPQTGQTITCTLPTIQPLQQSPFEIAIEVNAGFDLSETCVTNLASVSSTTTDADPDNNSDDAETCIGPNADVAITKTGPAWGADGYPLQYTLSVVNNGPATAEDVVVTDALPAGVSFNSATPTVGTCGESSGTVTCQLGDMTVGATATIIVVVTPDSSVVGTTIHNVATAISPTPDPDPGNNEDDEDTPIEDNKYPTSSNVKIVKSVNNATPSVGDEVTFDMVVSNEGPDTARDVAVTDTLPTGLIYVGVSGDGTCTFVTPTLTCQLGDLPVGQTRTIHLRAIVSRSGPIVNLGVVTASNDRVPGDNTDTAPVTSAASRAKLRITKTPNKKTVTVGRQVKFTIKVKNISKVTAVDVEVCDRIPSRLSVVRKAGGTLKKGSLCWQIDVLKPGKTRTFKPTFRVNNGSSRTVTNPATAKGYNTSRVNAKAKIKTPARGARKGGTTG